MLIVYMTGHVPVRLYIGEKFSVGPADLLDIASVYIQADCDELARIIAWGYPNHGRAVQTYIGDQAKQILANWNTYYSTLRDITMR